MKLKRVLFVGAFNTNISEGKIGGQLFACNSIIKSKLSESFQFIKLDSTWSTIKKPSAFNRIFSSVKRLIYFFYCCLFKRIKVVLVFTSYGASFIEKGVMIIIAKILGKKTILFPRSGYLKNQIDQKGYMHCYLNLVAKRTDVLLCQSKSWESYYSEKIKHKAVKYFIIENWLSAVNTENLYLKQPKNELFNILYFNRIEKEKGIYDFIDAIKELTFKKFPFTASIYGDGKEVNNMLEYIHNLELQPWISYKGWLFEENKTEILPKHNVYVFSSHFEGFPNTLLEIMSYGIPIISTDVGAIPDLIVDGDNGFLIDVGNYKKMAQRIYEIYSEPEKAMNFSKKCFARIKENNSIENAIEKFNTILN